MQQNAQQEIDGVDHKIVKRVAGAVVQIGRQNGKFPRYNDIQQVDLQAGRTPKAAGGCEFAEVAVSR